ncbi:hypothetical protein [Algoriphagus formosus]|uniref:hypothetical protein n=1 Tax=Algoriphagus formosus TaxID=2007308 RepID=UPI000C293D78|nr:hypothetical protein [Algoriphagus formosus]
MDRYFILIEQTDYVAKNQLTEAIRKQFLKLNKTVTEDLEKSIRRLKEISRTAHNLHSRCKEMTFEVVDEEYGPGMEGTQYHNVWCGHWGVAIAKFYKIEKEVSHD